MGGGFRLFKRCLFWISGLFGFVSGLDGSSYTGYFLVVLDGLTPVPGVSSSYCAGDSAVAVLRKWVWKVSRRELEHCKLWKLIGRVVVGVHRSSSAVHQYSSVFVARTSGMSFAPPTLRLPMSDVPPTRCPTLLRPRQLVFSGCINELTPRLGGWRLLSLFPGLMHWLRCWHQVGVSCLVLSREVWFMFSVCSSSCQYILAHRRMIALDWHASAQHASIGNPPAKIYTQGTPLSRSLNSCAIERLRSSMPIGYHSRLVKTDCSCGKQGFPIHIPGILSANLCYHRFFLFISLSSRKGHHWTGNPLFPTGTPSLDKPYLCALELVAR